MMMQHSSKLRHRLDWARIAIFVVPALLAAAADGARIRVAQESNAGAGDFHQHILGHIGPVASNVTVDETYAYDEFNRFSFNGERPVLRANVSHLFFIETPEGLALFIVHDSVDDPDGGSASMRIQVVGNRRPTRLLLRDDAFSPNDSYQVNAAGTEFLAAHSWHPCCTDGLVLGPLSGPWKVYVQFVGDPDPTVETAHGLRLWAALSDSHRIKLALERGRRVLLEPVDTFVFDSDTGGVALTTVLPDR